MSRHPILLNKAPMQILRKQQMRRLDNSKSNPFPIAIQLPEVKIQHQGPTTTITNKSIKNDQRSPNNPNKLQPVQPLANNNHIIHTIKINYRLSSQNIIRHLPKKSNQLSKVISD